MLQLEQLTCGYGAFRAVEGLSFEAKRSQVFALVGANGAGKSSTLMAIAGHVDIHAGKIKLDGTDITNMPVHQRVRSGIAIVPEGRRLFPDLSVVENLIVGGYIHSSTQAKRNQERVFGLFPRLAERRLQLAGSLSGGEQQMVAIGRALMAEPKLLLIDEASLGLMPKVIDLCYAAIRRLAEHDMTILLVEQSTQRALEISHAVCVLESGRAVWQGSANEARNNPAMIESYLGLQTRT